MLTRKHFRLIAAELCHMGATREDAEAMADVLADTNPRFNAELFIKAATGYYPETSKGSK